MPKILIVDDETKFLELVQIRLEDNGFEVISAKNGRDGLEKVRVNKPDLIISDVLMPVMDGYRFYKELKKNRATSNIPVLILTARGNMEDAFRVVGADEFLIKPVKTQELLKKVNKLLSTSVQVSPRAPQGPLKALIVGSQRDVVESIDFQLKIQECETDFVMTVEEVEPKVMSFSPEILVLDVLMGSMESPDIVKTVRSLPQTEKIPIVLYSFYNAFQLSAEDGKRKVHGSTASAKHCMELGATAYLGMYNEQFFTRDIAKYLKR